MNYPAKCFIAWSEMPPDIFRRTVATSLVALVMGLRISLLSILFWKPAPIIRIITLTFTAIGIQLGRIVGANFKLDKYAEIIGGLVLIGIGVKILWEHGVF